jgi:hypothetical protein
MLEGYPQNELCLKRCPLNFDKFFVRILFLVSAFAEINCQGMDRLGDWPKVVQNFSTIMQKLKLHATSPPPDTSSPAPVRLLRLLARNECSQQYSKIEGNFLVAAVHVACMKEVAFPHGSFPDIPDNLEEMAE